MNFDDLATKDDLKALESKILKMIERKTDDARVPEVVLSKKAKEMLGGISDTVLQELRREGKLNPKKAGKLWLWNVQEIVRLLPPDPL